MCELCLIFPVISNAMRSVVSCSGSNKIHLTSKLWFVKGVTSFSCTLFL